MNLSCREMLLIALWMPFGFVPGIQCKDGTGDHLSREDVLLLKDEQNPKCFTRTVQDFTCFFETADNRTYDFFYKTEQHPTQQKRCDVSVQRTEEGTFLHVCSLPESAVYMYMEIDLEVVEQSTNTSLYNRTVSVEDHILLDPPFNVSLHQNGQERHLQVSMQANYPKRFQDVMYLIRYSSKGLGEKTKEAKDGDMLQSLIAGEEVELQVKVKCALSKSAGHWSGWSQPVRAIVPQSADDISLICYTPDLENITCQWNGSRYGGENEYKLFYKTEISEALGWTEWTECLAYGLLPDLCSFRGDESSKIRVKLSGSSAPLSRTFYSQDFTLMKAVKTPPPSNPRIALEEDKMCLRWDSPLPSLSAHLQYEVSQQIREKAAWMPVSLSGPETSTCLQLPAGIKCKVKIRARPMGSVYSGYWSDWSQVLSGDTPADSGMLLLLGVPASMLIFAIILITLFQTQLRKLKQCIWPPVPNLDKVLQDYLTEINGQKWNPPVAAKECPEETIPSVVEVMSEDELSLTEKPSEESTQLLSSDRNFPRREQADGSPGTEVFPDYVTLNKDSVILCQKGNKYVDEYETSVTEEESPTVKVELFQTCQTSFNDVHTNPALATDFLNHSYLPLAERADKLDCKITAARVPGNLYTNLPCS